MDKVYYDDSQPVELLPEAEGASGYLGDYQGEYREPEVRSTNANEHI